MGADINRPKIPQMPKNLSAQIVCPSPKVLDFDEKRIHWSVITTNIFAVKETKGRSSGQTPFTIKPKQLALKKQFLTPQKYFPN